MFPKHLYGSLCVFMIVLSLTLVAILPALFGLDMLTAVAMLGFFLLAVVSFLVFLLIMWGQQ
jgi:archaellum biogenesis protein FlaJ (TadC family)